MFNRVILVGNLVEIPKIRALPSGDSAATIRIAVNSKVGNNEETLFINVLTYGKQAENCHLYLNKGDAVLVEGRLRQRTWEQDGNKKTGFEVVANRVVFMPRKKNGEQSVVETEEGVDEPVTTIEPF